MNNLMPKLKNDAFKENPIITVIQLVEEADIVIEEGRVTCQMKNGSLNWMLHFAMSFTLKMIGLNRSQDT